MFTRAPKPTLIVHGGAWANPPEMAADHLAGVAQALKTGHAILEWGGTATDAVEAAVTILEDDPTFDAGRGSFLTSKGTVQLDALLMDGATLRAGGVACVERLRNPIQAARLVLDKSPHIYFVGSGAEAFAASHGMALIDNSELVLDRERIRLKEAQSRLSSGLADITFSGVLAQDDKSPETSATTRPAGPCSLVPGPYSLAITAHASPSETFPVSIIRVTVHVAVSISATCPERSHETKAAFPPGSTSDSCGCVPLASSIFLATVIVFRSITAILSTAIIGTSSHRPFGVAAVP